VASVSTAANRKPIVCGKPTNHIYTAVKEAFPQVTSAKTLVIGDRVGSDILMAANCGMRSLMVGTGIDQLEDAIKMAANPEGEGEKLLPTMFADSLKEVWNKIKD